MLLRHGPVGVLASADGWVGSTSNLSLVRRGLCRNHTTRIPCARQVGPTQHQHLQPSPGSCSTGVDLIILQSHRYLLVRLPDPLSNVSSSAATQSGPSPHDNKARYGGVGRWVGGPVGSRACASFSRSSRHPSPAQYELLARLRTGAGATDWLLGLRFWRSSSGDGSVLFPQYISGILTSQPLLKHNWPAMSDRQYCRWSTSRQLECFTPHHLMDVCYHRYSSSSAEITLGSKPDLKAIHITTVELDGGPSSSQVLRYQVHLTRDDYISCRGAHAAHTHAHPPATS